MPSRPIQRREAPVYVISEAHVAKLGKILARDLELGLYDPQTWATARKIAQFVESKVCPNANR